MLKGDDGVLVVRLEDRIVVATSDRNFREIHVVHRGDVVARGTRNFL